MTDALAAPPSARKGKGATRRFFRIAIPTLCAAGMIAAAARAEAAGGPPPLGTYACASFRTFVGVVISSIGTLHLVSPSAYVLDVGNAATGTSVPARGTYVVALTHGGKHPDQAKLTFAGPVLGGHWGYVDRKKDGSIYAIVFPDDENEKPFDQGATFCYYQRGSAPRAAAPAAKATEAAARPRPPAKHSSSSSVGKFF